MIPQKYRYLLGLLAACALLIYVFWVAAVVVVPVVVVTFVLKAKRVLP
jgi:hypothetical protein